MENTRKKKALKDFIAMKNSGQKVAWLTAYDFQVARIAQYCGVDMILVGDSAGNNLLGYPDTIPVTMEEMLVLAAAVRRGAPDTFLIGDMPLGSYQACDKDAVDNALRFVKETRMDAVKLEGGRRMAARIKAVSEAGVAVMGHIGYTPQSTDMVGVVQANSLEKFKTLLADALAVQEAGAWAVLLEAVPNGAAALIAKKLSIPVYGIGAGKDSDGVLAIVNDVIGLGTFTSRFVKRFSNAEKSVAEGIAAYLEQVRGEKFPTSEHCYPLADGELEKMRDYLDELSRKKSVRRLA